MESVAMAMTMAMAAAEWVVEDTGETACRISSARSVAMVVLCVLMAGHRRDESETRSACVHLFSRRRAFHPGPAVLDGLLPT